MPTLMHALRRVGGLLSGLPRGTRARALAEHLAQLPALPRRRDGPRVAMQVLDDPTYMAVLAGVARRSAERDGAAIDIIFVRSVNGAVGVGLRAALQRSSLLAWLLARQWLHALAPLAPHVAYRSRSWARTDLLDLWRAHRAWQRARQREGDFHVAIAGIEVGDLVVDSYLRFRPSPRFDRNDAFVLSILWQAHRDVRRARAYFTGCRPQLYLTTYSTYLEHGIAVRAALEVGVQVRVFGNFQTFGGLLTHDYPIHTPDTTGYASAFAAQADSASALAEADVGLRQRLGGAIDDATRYMKTSAYATAGEPVPDVGGAVVVFLHDFYDSPHVYADLVFQDFWDWIVCTIETLSDNATPFFLKPHPNQISLSEGVLDELRRVFPGLRFLSPRVSNAQLAQAGMACGVTVYGTVAHELAYLGVPSIACARHPHHSFGFCRTARHRDEYRDMLATPHLRPLPVEEMRRQALAFYYMHNLHAEPAALELRRRFLAFWAAGTSESTPDADWLASYRELLASPGFAGAALAME